MAEWNKECYETVERIRLEEFNKMSDDAKRSVIAMGSISFLEGNRHGDPDEEIDREIDAYMWKMEKVCEMYASKKKGGSHEDGASK